MTKQSLRDQYQQDILTLGVFSDAQMETIEQAFGLAYMAHEGQVRTYDETPFVTHPIAVSVYLAKRYKNSDLTIAGLLHDTVEDSDQVSMSQVYEQFGREIGFLVDAVTDDPLYMYEAQETIYEDKIEKILAGGMVDVRVLLLKIADREHNLQTLHGLKPKKQVRMAFETQAIYVPLKAILGDETDIAKAQERFDAYMRTKELQDPWALKNNLYAYVYDNIDSELYTMVYQDTGSIVREINDEERYMQLLEDEKFEESCQLISLATDGTSFSAKFQFIRGSVLPTSDAGFLKVSDYATLVG